MSVNLTSAKKFVEGLNLQDLPRYRRRVLAPSAFQPDPAKEQALVVGSEIISFAKGVTAQRRDAIANSSLLSQLVANQAVRDQTKILTWYDKYFEVLTNVGWIIQERGFVEFKASTVDMDVNKAILSVAASLLGGTTTAGYQLIKATMDAVKSTSNSPWITLFERESLHERAARFQVGLVDQGTDEGFLVSLMAFSLEASARLTQVLVFRFRSQGATLKQLSGKITINDTVFDSVSNEIKAKIMAFSSGYIKGLPDLELPNS